MYRQAERSNFQHHANKEREKRPGDHLGHRTFKGAKSPDNTHKQPYRHNSGIILTPAVEEMT
jgi:hypothetical protein